MSSAKSKISLDDLHTRALTIAFLNLTESP
jgi:hypothetical protein